jgi:hypothetical protein
MITLSSWSNRFNIDVALAFTRVTVLVMCKNIFYFLIAVGFVCIYVLCELSFALFNEHSSQQ